MWLMVKTIRDQNKYNAKKKNPSSTPNKTFEDIGGCQEAKKAIGEIIDYIRSPEKFKNLGIKMPRGVLLHGPPGTGKTLVAKAAAKEAGIPVIYASGSEFVELFVGMGAKRVRELFSQARQIGTCMIFIDEIDAVGYSRKHSVGGGSLGGNREAETTLN